MNFRATFKTLAILAVAFAALAASTTPVPFGISGHKICFLDASCTFSGTTFGVMSDFQVPAGQWQEINAGTTQALTNAQCGSYVIGNVSGTVATLPDPPRKNCDFWFEPKTADVTVDAGTNYSVAAPGMGNHSGDRLIWKVWNFKVGFVQYHFDGVKWTIPSHSGGVYEGSMPLDGQQLAQGGVYFNSDGSANFQLCPKNGGGLSIDGHLHRIIKDCLKTPWTSGTSSALNYAYASNIGSVAVTGTANNGSGKVRLTVSSMAITGIVAGDYVGMICHSIRGTTEADGIDVVGLIVDLTHIDEINVNYSNAFSSSVNASCRVDYIQLSTTAHATTSTGYPPGLEVMSGDESKTFIGIAYEGAANAVNDSITKRDVASWFNRKMKTCYNHYTANRTTTSGTYAEVNSEIECEFVTLAENDLDWRVAGMASNGGAVSTNAISAGFDGITPESEETGFVGAITVPFATVGSKAGLSEGKHYITLLAKASSGTLTLFGTTPDSYTEVRVPQ